jgi:hypothetical protein
MESHDLTGARSPQCPIDWIDRKTVAHQLLREDRIGHAFERVNHT